MRFRIDIYSDKSVKVTWPGYEKVFAKDELYQPNWPHSLYVNCSEKEIKIEEIDE